MKFFTAFLLIFSATIAFANTEGKSNISYSMAGLEAGFKWSSMDADGSGSDKQSIGYQIGASGTFDIATNFAIKSGLFYNERPFKVTNSVGSFNFDTTGKITYFDIPVLLMFKFEDYAGVYFGPSFSIKMSDEISSGSLSNIKDIVVPLTIGGQFKFAPNLGVNVFFETVSGQLADGLKNSRAVGANLLVTFD